MRLALGLFLGISGVCASFSIADQSAQPGQTVITSLSFAAEGQTISGIQFDLQWDASLDVQATVGSQIGPSGKALYSAAPAARTLRIMIAGFNPNPLNEGEALRLLIAVGAGAQATGQIRVSNAMATTPDGRAAPIPATSANVQIQGGATAAALQAGDILNAGSFLSGPISPGEIITVLGVQDPAASGVVVVNGQASPTLYAGTRQINAVVPFGLDMSGPATVEVQSQGKSLGKTQVAVTPASPAIFALSANGTGPGAILNQDYSVNSYSNPAAVNSIVMIYGTGFGVVSPPTPDGQNATGPAGTVTPVTATVGGVPAEVIYAGAAPSLVAGAAQINVRIPQGLPPNPATPLLLSIGGVTTPAGVTVAVQ